MSVECPRKQCAGPHKDQSHWNGVQDDPEEGEELSRRGHLLQLHQLRSFRYMNRRAEEDVQKHSANGTAPYFSPMFESDKLRTSIGSAL